MMYSTCAPAVPASWVERPIEEWRAWKIDMSAVCQRRPLGSRRAHLQVWCPKPVRSGAAALFPTPFHFSDLATRWASDLRGLQPFGPRLAKPPLAAAKPLLPCLVAGDVVGALRGA